MMFKWNLSFTDLFIGVWIFIWLSGGCGLPEVQDTHFFILVIIIVNVFEIKLHLVNIIFIKLVKRHALRILLINVLIVLILIKVHYVVITRRVIKIIVVQIIVPQFVRSNFLCEVYFLTTRPRMLEQLLLWELLPPPPSPSPEHEVTAVRRLGLGAGCGSAHAGLRVEAAGGLGGHQVPEDHGHSL